MKKFLKKATALGIIVGVVMSTVVLLVPEKAQSGVILINTSQMDATISQANPDTNYGSSNFLEIGTRPNENTRFLIKFDLSSIIIPPGNRITSATVHLCMVLVEQGPGEYDLLKAVKVRRVKSSWTEATVTWNNQPEYEKQKISIDVQPNWDSFVITSAVTGWYHSLFENNGLLVSTYYEDGDAEGDSWSVTYTSKEWNPPPSWFNPFLEITYEPDPPYQDEIIEVWYKLEQSKPFHGPCYIYAQFETIEMGFNRYRLDLESPDVPSASGPTYVIEVVVPMDWLIVTINGTPIVNMPDVAVTGGTSGRYPGTVSWFIENVDNNPPTEYRIFAGVTYYLWFLAPPR